MKKFLFLIAFFSIATMTNINAQTEAAPLTAAIEAAKNDPNIIQKVGQDGSITFKQKSVCSKSGKVSYKAVQFDAKSKTWTAAKGGASCSSKKSGKAGKACCSSKKSGKSCGSAKGKSCSGAKAKSCGSKTKAKAKAAKKCGNGKCGVGKCGGK